MIDEGIQPATYADQFVDWLVDEGYTHCFFLAGGNIMHLLNSARTRLTCIPVVNEVAAGIAVEYFNALRPTNQGKALALVTAGPGVTNILTAMAGAFLESRELLVVAGQVKSGDLSEGRVRQRGIQEVDGCALANPISKATLQIRYPRSRREVFDTIHVGQEDRKGPVFIEFCLDAQAAAPLTEKKGTPGIPSPSGGESSRDLSGVSLAVETAERPVLLLGGGVSRELAMSVMPELESLGMPIMTSWNALDRIAFDHPLFLGRPDTWGMRAANIVLQQADLVIAVGARLSLQQTGFAWEEFVPLGKVVHVDLDPAELEKEHPRKDIRVLDSAESFLSWLAHLPQGGRWEAWRSFGKMVLTAVPLDDPQNTTNDGFVSPYRFSSLLSDELTEGDVLIPCSSGGASTVLMQSFRQKSGQKVMNDKALASMGYGLSGAIGAAIANPRARTVLVEGDGGFAQNLQELGTVAAQRPNLKMFIFANEGYASIRMTQRNYFAGAWIGCDASTGVGLPDWAALSASYGIPFVEFDPDRGFDDAVLKGYLDDRGPCLVAVPIDPEQTYFPKISSRLTESGTMRSNPLHMMDPVLPAGMTATLLPYLTEGGNEQD